MMTAEQLKASILQLAMEGKLVEQRREEGTGEDLFRQVEEIRTKLVKRGILKEDNVTSISSDEIPYDIPDNWMWVRFGELFDIGSAIRIHKTDWKKEGIPFFRGRELVRLIKNGDPQAEIYISPELYEQNKAKGGVPLKDDLLVSAVGTIGKVYVVKGTAPFYYKDAYILRFNNYAKLFPKYFQYVIASPFEQNFIKQGSMGTTVAQLTISKAKSMLCPLPPLEEQMRIVTKLEKLIPFVAQYTIASEKLVKLNREFPDQVKKSILQMAVEGKLVEQRPEEGTGEELFRKIQEEKAKLIKEGKIKKQKPLTDIADEEKPFDIPESWKWVYVGQIFDHNTGKAINASAKKTEKAGSIRPFITTSNLYWNYFDLSVVKQMFFSDDELERCTIKKGDLVMCEGGAYFGRSAIWNYDYDICFQNHVHRIRPYAKLDLKFYYYVFYLYRTNNMMKSKGTAMPGLSSVALHQIMVPLPPLDEQKRIVEKLDVVLPLTDQLTQSS